MALIPLPGKAPKNQVIRVLFTSYELSSRYEAEVAPDITAAEVVESLTGENSWLGRLAPGERYRLILLRTDTDIAHTFAGAGVRDSDEILVLREAHGAGPGALDVAAGLAAAKLTIDAARVGVDAYRARTERLSVELEREKLESEETDNDPPPDPA